MDDAQIDNDQSPNKSPKDTAESGIGTAQGFARQGFEGLGLGFGENGWNGGFGTSESDDCDDDRSPAPSPIPAPVYDPAKLFRKR